MQVYIERILDGPRKMSLSRRKVAYHRDFFYSAKLADTGLLVSGMTFAMFVAFLNCFRVCLCAFVLWCTICEAVSKEYV